MLRRQESSRSSSRVGLTRYIVSYRLRSVRISAYRYAILAASDWALFSSSRSEVSAPTTAAENEAIDDLFGTMSTSLAQELSASSPTPESSAPSLMPQPLAPSNQSDGTHQPGATQVVVLPDATRFVRDESGATPTQPIQTSDQLGLTPNQLDTVNPYANNAPARLDLSQPPTATTAPSLSDTDTSRATPIPSFIHPLSPIDELQWAIPSHTRSQASARFPSSPPDHGTMSLTNSRPPSNPLADVTDEPGWMKKKRTLDYFRNTFILGDLSSVIKHWYKLERLLGFQGIVSVLGSPILYRANDLMMFRPHQGFRRPNAQQSCVYFIRMHIVTKRIITWRFTP